MAEDILTQSGVYVIRNVRSGRVYVGSSKNIPKRWSAHKTLLRQGRHHSPFLQNAWNSHGEFAFEFKIIEAVEIASDLFGREQFWIDKLGAYIASGGMNAAAWAGMPMLGRKLPEQHKAKIAAKSVGRKHSDETKQKQREWHLGRPRSEETKAKLRVANLGKKTHNEESIEKLRAANLGKKMSPDAIARTAASWTGRKHSEETKRKISAARAGKKLSQVIVDARMLAKSMV